MPDPTPAQAFANRLFEAALGTFDLMSVYLGDKLGYYRALSLSKHGLTSPQLAEKTNTDERYAREWLEQQAATGILNVGDVQAAAQRRRYTLPAAHATVLLNETDLSYIGPVARQVMAAARQLPAVADAYRSGGGVSWRAYGPDMREAQAALNRPFFANQLAKECLPAIRDVHAALTKGRPARVADIACGGGWSSIAIAKAYPKAHVDGFDLDEPSVRLARKNAKAEGVADRVTFYCQDAAGMEHTGAYDLVIICEALHDFSRPVEALTTMRKLASKTGTVIVVDERVGEEFSAPADAVERYFYGWSITTCLPDGMSHKPSAATGTVMRRPTLLKYAKAAGFKRAETLPITNDFFRFYRLE